MEKQILADNQVTFLHILRYHSWSSFLQDYDEAKEKKIQMDEFRLEVYKTLEITDLLELQGGPRNH